MNKRFHFSVAVVLLLVTLGCLQGMSRPREVPLIKPLSDIPLALGTWNGHSITFDERTLDNAGVDQYIMRTYHTPAHAPVSVYVGFYSHQKVGHTIHSPRRCYPGSGWELVSAEKKRIPAAGAHRKQIPVNSLLIRRNDAQQMVYYWYQSRGRIITSEYREKLYMILDTIVRGRNDGALVRISTEAFGSAQETEESLREFVGDFYPQLMQCLP